MPAQLQVRGAGVSSSSRAPSAATSNGSSRTQERSADRHGDGPPGRPAPGAGRSDSARGGGSANQRGGPAPRGDAHRGGSGSRPRREPEVLFQKRFKSVGPRTYEAHVMRAGNGNHYLVFGESKPDEVTGEARRTRLFVFSEDFDAFWDLLRDTARFVREHPVPEDVREKRARFWAGQGTAGRTAVNAPPPAASVNGTAPSRRPAPASTR